jgi:hypothetical protein
MLNRRYVNRLSALTSFRNILLFPLRRQRVRIKVSRQSAVPNDIFSGRQPRQDVEVLRRFGTKLRPHRQGVLVVW